MAQQARTDFVNGRFETAPFQRTALGIDAKKNQSRDRPAPADNQLSEVFVLSQQYSPLTVSSHNCFGVGQSRRKLGNIHNVVAGRPKKRDQRRVNAFVGEPAHDSAQP